MKPLPLAVILLVSLSTFSAFANGSPTDNGETQMDSFNQEMPPYSPDTDVNDIYSSAPRLRRADRHHHGFVAGAATGAVVANHHQPNYYAPTYYYPPAYYPPPNYYDNGYNYYY